MKRAIHQITQDVYKWASKGLVQKRENTKKCSLSYKFFKHVLSIVDE